MIHPATRNSTIPIIRHVTDFLIISNLIVVEIIPIIPATIALIDTSVTVYLVAPEHCEILNSTPSQLIEFERFKDAM